MIVLFTVARRRRKFSGFRTRFLPIPLYFERFITANSLSETGSIFSGLVNQGSITLDGPLVWPRIHQTGGPPNLGSTKPGVHQPRSPKNWGSTKPGVHLLFPEKPGVHGPPVYRWTGGPSATLVLMLRTPPCCRSGTNKGGFLIKWSDPKNDHQKIGEKHDF